MNPFKKMRVWLVNKYLPEYARLALEADNRRLEAKVAELEETLRLQRAYCRGILRALRTIGLAIEMEDED